MFETGLQQANELIDEVLRVANQRGIKGVSVD